MKITVKKIFYKPNTRIETVDIYGFKFIQQILSPSLYVVNTDDEILEGSDLEFEIDEISYSLTCVNIVKSNGKVFIECRDYVEKYLK